MKTIKINITSKDSCDKFVQALIDSGYTVRVERLENKFSSSETVITYYVFFEVNEKINILDDEEEEHSEYYGGTGKEGLDLTRDEIDRMSAEMEKDSKELENTEESDNSEKYVRCFPKFEDLYKDNNKYQHKHVLSGEWSDSDIFNLYHYSSHKEDYIFRKLK